MLSLIEFFTALAISMALIPTLIRYAPRFGMIDQPDPRKVHSIAVARVGGIGIITGALVPIALWLPHAPWVLSYLLGALVLLVFGAWDDARGLGARVKFFGQFLAAAPIVYYGDIFITGLPFVDAGNVPEWFGRPFTVFAIMGMINALNVSDGLDGLAGGLTILSLACITFLASTAEIDGIIAVAIAIATFGGIFGFLRYNTHPARVFMGDCGSQFLGFTLGFLTVALTQKINPALSPATPLLLLGLPILDLLVVSARRISRGASPFVADKQHLHHRLLGIGFDHYEAVIIIYAIQTAFVLGAVFLRYESDTLVLTAYFGFSISIFLLLTIAEHGKWKARQSDKTSHLTNLVVKIRQNPLLTQAPYHVVALGLSILFVAISLLTGHVPRDFGVGAVILSGGLLVYLFFLERNWSLVPRAVLFITAAFIVYLESRHTARGQSWFATAEIAYFLILAIAVMVVVRYGANNEFTTTPTDYLIILVIITVGILAESQPGMAQFGPMAIKLVILFYSCELLLARMRHRWNLVTAATLGTLAILGARGLL